MTPESNLFCGLFNMSKGLIWAWTELTELIGLMYENLLISQKQLFQVHNLGLKGTQSYSAFVHLYRKHTNRKVS